MAKVRFNLFDKNTDEETYVFLIFRYNGLRLKYSTGLKIPPKYWDFAQQSAKSTVKFPYHAEFNSDLNSIANEVIRIFKTHQFEQKALSLDEFRSLLDQFSERKTVLPEQKKTLFEFVEQFIQERSNQPHNTTKIFKTLQNHLIEYAKTKRKGKLDYEDITLEFFHAFREYLYAEPRSHSTNYASKLIDVLRQMLDESTERGFNTNIAYKSKRFRIGKEEVQKIYLTLDELNTIYNYDFSQNERLERVRDLFIIGCFTGLRFIDFTNIKPEHIKNVDGVDMIQIVTQKTGEPVAIPLHPYVKQILEKHDAKIPRPLSNQKMNDYLKEIGQVVGLEDMQMVVKSKGGKNVSETLPKYKLIGTHTARRSFATNAYKMNIPSIAIMKITGHRTERQFMKYIKVSKEENAVLIANNAFFKI